LRKPYFQIFLSGLVLTTTFLGLAKVWGKFINPLQIYYFSTKPSNYNYVGKVKLGMG